MAACCCEKLGAQVLPDTRLLGGFLMDTLTVISDVDDGPPTRVQLVMHVEEVAGGGTKAGKK